MNHRNAGLALELLSPLFFLRLSPVFAPHSRLEPILQSAAFCCSPFRNPASKNGAGWHQGSKMIIESMKE